MNSLEEGANQSNNTINAQNIKTTSVEKFESICQNVWENWWPDKLIPFLNENAWLFYQNPKIAKYVLETQTDWINGFSSSTLKEYLKLDINWEKMKNVLNPEILDKIEMKIHWSTKRELKEKEKVEAFRKQADEQKRKQQWDADDLKNQL